SPLCMLFFSIGPPPTEIYTLSLHDALPISALDGPSRIAVQELLRGGHRHEQLALAEFIDSGQFARHLGRMRRLYRDRQQALRARSEEHTSELQSRENLVCRLLLEKKKK